MAFGLQFCCHGSETRSYHTAGAMSRTRDHRRCTHGSDGEPREEAMGHREERKEGEGKLLDMMGHSGDAGGDDDEARRRR